jgi:hypothetical protein
MSDVSLDTALDTRRETRCPKKGDGNRNPNPAPACVCPPRARGTRLRDIGRARLLAGWQAMADASPARNGQGQNTRASRDAERPAQPTRIATANWQTATRSSRALRRTPRVALRSRSNDNES